MKSQIFQEKETKNVLRIPIHEIVIYELTKEELNILKRGDAGVHLSIAITLFSLAFPLLITFFTQNGMTDFTKGCYLIFAVISIVGGSISSILSWKGKSDFKEVVVELKNAMKNFIVKRNKSIW